MLEAKKTNILIEKQFHHQNPMLFIEKQSSITKNLEHHGKSITGPPKISNFFKKNEMTCCKNVKPSLKTKSALKKAFKFNGKNVHSTVLQNAWSQKDQHFHSKLILDIAKSWLNQIFNSFLIRILIRKSNHQNQDIAKSSKNQFFNYF